MRIWCKILTGFSLLAGQVGILTGQQAPCAVRTVVVGVFNKNGQPVQDLAAKDFKPRLRGEPAQVTSARYDNSPRRIVVLLDSSGSMAHHEPRLQLSVAEELAASVPAETSIALLTFSDTATEKIEFCPTPRLFADRFRGLETRYLKELRGKTRINDAIEEGLSFLGQPRTGDVLLVMSDGEDNRSKTTPDKLKRDLVNAGVRLFAFLTVPPLPLRARTPDEMPGGDMQVMCKETGGDSLLVYAIENSFAIKAKVDSIATEISSIYLLEVRPPQGLDKPRHWKLEVETPESKPKSQLHLIYPRYLMPCQSSGK